MLSGREVCDILAQHGFVQVRQRGDHMPVELWHVLQAIAPEEASTVASVLRRLAKERLDQLRKQR